jgi:3-oxoacyl-[acyl-carrier protein] reductase
MAKPSSSVGDSPGDSLAGKTILVTGAAKRIGRGVALRLAQEGARVAIHYGRSEAEARRTAQDCAGDGGGAQLFQANLESVAEIARMFGEVEARLGRLDGLVNNAARFTRFDPLDITEQDWDLRRFSSAARTAPA